MKNRFVSQDRCVNQSKMNHALSFEKRVVAWLSAVIAAMAFVFLVSSALAEATERCSDSLVAPFKFKDSDVLKDDRLLPAAISRLSPSGVEGYFLLPRNLKLPGLKHHITFDDIGRLLPQLKQMGVNVLWMSPPNPQTFESYNGDVNDHGYWIADHGAVDGKFGGEAAFARLVQRARALGIEICLDTVTNHFGYVAYQQNGEWVYPDVQIDGKSVSTNDPNYFRVDKNFPEGYVANRMSFLYERLNAETNPDLLRSYQQELTQFNLMGLPSFNHTNPLVQEYLISSYKKYFDRGIRVFRMDAIKHINQAFISLFMNELQKYAAEKGERVTFIHEMMVTSSPSLAVFASDLLAQSQDASRVFFLDFPMAQELRRMQDPSYQFSWLEGFIRYRQDHEQPIRQYIPMIEDHDFSGPISTPFSARLLYTLSDFFSYNPVFLYQGAEVAAENTVQRPVISGLNANGDIAEIRAAMAQAMPVYRNAQGELPRIQFHIKERDSLLAELRMPDRSLFVYVNKGIATDQQFASVLSQHTAGVTPRVIVQENNPTVTVQSSGISLIGPPKSFVVFEVMRNGQ